MFRMGQKGSMDRISHLPDELLLKILSSLPTIDVVATMLLSKRWKPLWMLVSNLEYYDTSNSDTDKSSFSRFVQRSLLLNESPFLESLFFELSSRSGALDLKICVKLAITRCLRKLEILVSCIRIQLPESLYTCKTLEYLHLHGTVHVNAPDRVSLPSLTNLFLIGLTYSSNESVHRLLSGCPVLKYLDVQRISTCDNVKIFPIKVPSLLALKICRESEVFVNINHGIVVDAPSLLVLTIKEYNGGFCLLENIPKLSRAEVDVVSRNCQKLMGSLTYVKHLRLCLLVPMPAYPKGTTFYRLRNLELCTCIDVWLNLLVSLLQNSPKLRVLKLRLDHLPRTNRPAWNHPSSVPECMSSELKIFDWNGYKGTPEERELVNFILRNGNSLKTVIISPESTNLKQKFQMIKELTLSSRGSPTCQLIFN